MVRDKRIGVLAVQETHLTGDHVDHLHHLFSKRLHIISTIDETEPNSKGVAIVLNKEITNIHNVESTVIVQTRALLMMLPWHQGEKLSILAIYVSNSPTANENFWKEVTHLAGAKTTQGRHTPGRLQPSRSCSRPHPQPC